MPGMLKKLALIGVLTVPGPIPLTRMPCGARETGHALGQHGDAALGGGVVDQHRVSHDGVDRAHVDDRAAGAGLHHVARGGLPAQERALEVHADHAVELFLGEVQERDLRLHGGIRHHAIEPPEALDGAADQAAHLRGVPHVGRNRERGGAETRRLGLDLRREPVRQRDAGAFLDEPLGDREPDAPGRTGDDGDLALEPHHAALDERDRLDLDEVVRVRERRGRDQRGGGELRPEELLADRHQILPVAHVGEEERELHDVGEGAAAGLDHGLEVLEGLSGLGREIAAAHRPGPSRPARSGPR